MAAAAVPAMALADPGAWADAGADEADGDAAADGAAGGPGRRPAGAAACPAWAHTRWPRKCVAWARPGGGRGEAAAAAACHSR